MNPEEKEQYMENRYRCCESCDWYEDNEIDDSDSDYKRS